MEQLQNEITSDEKLKILFDDYFEEGIIPQLTEDEYKENLESFKKLKTNKLPYIHNIEHFCKLSGLSSKQVEYFLLNKRAAYSTFSLPKRNGGTREMVVVQKILISKQIFSLTSKNIKKQNISQITSRFRQLFRITGL